MSAEHEPATARHPRDAGYGVRRGGTPLPCRTYLTRVPLSVRPVRRRHRADRGGMQQGLRGQGLGRQVRPAGVERGIGLHSGGGCAGGLEAGPPGPIIASPHRDREHSRPAWHRAAVESYPDPLDMFDRAGIVHTVIREAFYRPRPPRTSKESAMFDWYQWPGPRRTPYLLGLFQRLRAGRHGRADLLLRGAGADRAYGA